MGDGVALLETGVGWSFEERVESLEGWEGKREKRVAVHNRARVT